MQKFVCRLQLRSLIIQLCMNQNLNITEILLLRLVLFLLIIFNFPHEIVRLLFRTEKYIVCEEKNL